MHLCGFIIRIYNLIVDPKFNKRVIKERTADKSVFCTVSFKYKISE